MTNFAFDLPGMTPSALGPTLFQRVLYCTRMAAERYAPGDYSLSATYDPVTHVKTGYRVAVTDRLAAMRVRIAHDLARKCQPMPWVNVTPRT